MFGYTYFSLIFNHTLFAIFISFNSNSTACSGAVLITAPAANLCPPPPKAEQTLAISFDLLRIDTFEVDEFNSFTTNATSVDTIALNFSVSPSVKSSPLL